MTKRTIVLSGVAVALLALSPVLLSQDPTAAAKDGGWTQSALAAFDQEAPGRGADKIGDVARDNDMAYALFASASILAGQVEPAIQSADWLVAHSRPGWGLGAAWDAFGDGSMNPPDTVYGITTALAVRALLDTYEATDDPRYAETARDALASYAEYWTTTPEGGFFWYSDQPQDANSVHNVTAMLAGQYARASVLFDDNGFAELARSAANYLMHERLMADDGDRWPYTVGAEKPNDAVHAAYIVQGLVEVERHLDTGHDLSGAVRFLETFFVDDRVLLFPHGHALTERHQSLPSNAWGVGMLIYTLCDVDKADLAEKAAGALSAYEFKPGVYAITPGKAEFLPRHQAHIAFGLARCGF